MEEFRRKTASYEWDEDDAFVYVVLALPPAPRSSVRVSWTEGTLEVRAAVTLLVPLAGRVADCSWDVREDGQLQMRLQKAEAGRWRRLATAETASSLPAAGAQREGLARLIKMPVPAAAARGSWPRRWKQRIMDAPLGYFAKLLHTTDYLDFIMWVLMAALVLVCPYTKVEESFGLQATHDVLYHRLNVAAYDHHTFPGVVARTFLGPLTLALVSGPWVALGHAVFGMSKPAAQIVVRLVLGSILVMCFKLFRIEVSQRFGQATSTALGLVSCTQFHLLFYMSRTLPNTFALGLILLGLKMWMNERYTRMLFIFTLCAVAMRFETVLLFAGVLVVVVFVTQRVRFFWAVWCGIVFGLLCLAITVGVDSIFWQRLLWPEGSGLLFNVVENQSHLYGVSPWHWYVTSALPRALLGALPLAAWGFVVQPRVRLFVIPAVLMVALFSFLPHKEVRFIFYAFPLLNLAAACAIESFWRKRSMIGLLAVFGLLVASLAASSVMLAAASRNYPGGEALQRLHQLKGRSALPGTSVWLDNLSLQTGVSRFQQERPDWLYSKVPEEEIGAYSDFTYIISEKQNIPGGFQEIGSVQAFSGLKKSWPPAVLTETRLRLWENVN